MTQQRSLNLIPMTQHWAWDLFDDMLNNFWLPNQIPTGLDKGDLSVLSADDKAGELHLFKNALAYLTTSDIQIGDNAQDGVEAAIKHMELDFEPVVRFPQGVQVCQERVHAKSYQEILETILSMTQDEQRALYEIWQEVPQMRAKIEFASEMNDALVNPTSQAELVAAFWWWYNIYEGTWFMNGFNPIFALSRARNIFKNVVEQLKYIQRDEATHVVYGQQLYLLDRRRKPTYDYEINHIIRNLIVQSYELEEEWINYLLPEPVFGYNAKDHLEHFKYLVNMRLTATQLPAFFMIGKSPFAWLSEYQLRNETNFFERHPTEYRTGATLNWD